MTDLDRLIRPYRQLSTIVSFVGSLALVGALLAGCGTDSENVPVVPGSDVEGTGAEELPIPAEPKPTPDMEEKLKIAEKAKDREKRDPNHFTTCLNPDGTLLGQIEHARGVDAPPLTEKEKQDVCEKQKRFKDPANNPASPERGGKS